MLCQRPRRTNHPLCSTLSWVWLQPTPTKDWCSSGLRVSVPWKPHLLYPRFTSGTINTFQIEDTAQLAVFVIRNASFFHEWRDILKLTFPMFNFEPWVHKSVLLISSSVDDPGSPGPTSSSKEKNVSVSSPELCSRSDTTVVAAPSPSPTRGSGASPIAATRFSHQLYFSIWFLIGKLSLICLGQTNDPLGNVFRSSQQLPCLHLGPSKGFLSLKGPGLAFCIAFGTTEKQGGHQMWRTWCGGPGVPSKNNWRKSCMSVCWKRTWSHRSLIVIS